MAKARGIDILKAKMKAKKKKITLTNKKTGKKITLTRKKKKKTRPYNIA